MATMLALIQRATSEMGLPVPSVVAGNTNADVVQELALLNAVGYELQREYQWEQIVKEYNFSTIYYEYTGDLTNGSTTISNLSSTTGLTSTPTYFMLSGEGINQSTTLVSVDSGASSAVMNQAATATSTGVSIVFGQTRYAFPSDYDRQVDRTHFDVSKHWEMIGPESQQQVEWLKSSYISTGPRIRYWIQSRTFNIWPIISAVNEYLRYVYVSNLWVLASTASEPDKTSFTVDTDTCIFPDTLMVLGLKKKYFEAKGMDANAYTRDYLMQLDMAKSMDSGSATLSMNPRLSSVLIGWENIPDANYGS